MGLISAREMRRVNAEILLSEISGRRCRLQGLDDASLHFGWICETDSSSVSVELSSKREIASGCFVYVEVSGPKSLLTFTASVAESISKLTKIEVASDIEQRPLKSESRTKVKVIEGEVFFIAGTEPTPISLVDVSEHGFGFVSQSPIQVTGPCKVVLKSHYGDVELIGDVRHARNDKASTIFRAGALILEMNRVSRARWTRLLEG